MANPNTKKIGREFDAPEPPEDTAKNGLELDTGTQEDTSKQEMADEYAKKKGLPVRFFNKAGHLLEGVLINWKDDNAFRVVGFDGNVLITKTVKASELYGIPENSRLQGAVEFAREHGIELQNTRSQISGMLKSVSYLREQGSKAA